MDTIKELYYGNIHPYEREIKKDSEIDRLAKLVLASSRTRGQN